MRTRAWVKDGSTLSVGVTWHDEPEYVHWYTPGDWGVAAFVDAGNANDERQLFKMNLATVSRFGRTRPGPIAVRRPTVSAITGCGCGSQWPSRSGNVSARAVRGQSTASDANANASAGQQPRRPRHVKTCLPSIGRATFPAFRPGA